MAKIQVKKSAAKAAKKAPAKKVAAKKVAAKKVAAKPGAAGKGPTKLTLRAYNVGFGDCFLLTFEYPKFKRRILIDYGSTAAPKNADDDYMMAIAKDIEAQCTDADGVARLDAVVATHRHRDHISGFSTEGDNTGGVIARMNPGLVIQPWTEDPDAQPKAEEATATTFTGGKPDAKAFIASLHNMNRMAGAIADASRDEHLGLSMRMATQMGFMGENNLPNKSAVVNLMEMGKKSRAAYVNAGSKSGLEAVLPGVTVHVLGPPTLKQTQSIKKEKDRDANEFWQFAAFWQFQAAAGESVNSKAPLFPESATHETHAIPANVRWFVGRAQKIRGEQLMELVRALDTAMNNTSVILLFQVGGKSFLFPGDAQIENWQFALSQEPIQEMLKVVDVYKVGHHGSLNATPKSLWALFEHKHETPAKDRLTTVVSTKPGKHGSVQSHTEVPRSTLVAELQKESDFFSTQDLPKSQICKEYEFEF
jgi:beta-lactamase superfamily II metal-dependent hydrolase